MGSRRRKAARPCSARSNVEPIPAARDERPEERIDPTLWLLAGIVGLAMTVQTAIGFGAIVVSVTLGAHAVPLDRLLPLVVPVSLVQNLAIVLRQRSDVRWGLLGRWVLPLVVAGLAFGVATVGPGRAAWLRPALGVLVLGLAALSLAEPDASADPAVGAAGGRRGAGRLASAAALLAGGVVQGLLATGGPLVVWGLAREGLDRRALRATLAAVWAAMNVVLVGSMVADGRIDGVSAGTSAMLLVPAGLGGLVGEVVHGRLDEPTFRRAVWLMLAVAALPLLW